MDYEVNVMLRLRILLRTTLALLCLISWLPVHADTGIVDGVKKAGRSVGSAARDIGRGAKKAGKTVGNVAKDGVGAVKRGGREVKDGVKDAVKGD